jgi:toxin ParE1/3/4
VKAKRVVPREQANRDVDEAVAYYLREGAEPIALSFIDALAQAYAHIGRNPATGSPRYAHELNLPGLRSRPLARFPHLRQWR